MARLDATRTYVIAKEGGGDSGGEAQDPILKNAQTRVYGLRLYGVIKSGRSFQAGGEEGSGAGV